MKKIHLQATKVFVALLKKLAENNEYRVNPPAAGLLPLTIEKMEENILTPLGAATIYALCHHRSSKGIRVDDPQMRFLVVDSRKHPDDTKGLAVVPYYFRSDESGEEQESIIIQNGLTHRILRQWQAGNTHYAATWLMTIKKQGYVK